MRILRIISRLLDYPRAELLTHRADLALEIGKSRELSPQMRSRLQAALGSLCDGDLMDAQENYGLLFDQGRSVSLHLFEHVHGESRDRGQAMVDLIDVYSHRGTVVRDAQHQVTAEPVEEGTDGFKDVAVEFGTGGFELNRNTFALLKDGLQLGRGHFF